MYHLTDNEKMWNPISITFQQSFVLVLSVCVLCVHVNSDTKRMEDLFSKNQQMKEQQRVLTENIKTLENRYSTVSLYMYNYDKIVKQNKENIHSF